MHLKYIWVASFYKTYTYNFQQMGALNKLEITGI